MTGRRFSTIFSNGSGFSSFAAQDHYPFWRSSSNALTLADKPHLTQCVCTRPQYTARSIDIDIDVYSATDIDIDIDADAGAEMLIMMLMPMLMLR